MDSHVRPTLVLAGGRVVTSLDPPAVVTADVVVAGDRVVAVGEAPVGAPRRDCSGTLVVPGSVCAHTHLYSHLARGMPYTLAAPRDFVEILQRVWWRLDRALDEETVRLSALAGGLDALLAGTTTLVDHHASPNAIDGSLDVIADALGEVGVRGLLCYEVTDRDGAERAVAGIAENARFAARPRALARGLVGAHASFTLSRETLDGCVAAARDAGVGLHLHAAEDAADQRDAQARYGTRVVHRLAGANALGPDTLLAHCVHVDAAEAGMVRDSGAAVAHNARSNMNNAVGHSPLHLLGPRVALGTDGIGADMVTEAQAAYFRAREADLDTGMDAVLARLAEGARFAGRAFGEPALGRIDAGAPADLVVLDYPAPTPLDAVNLAGHWLFGVSPRLVRDVVVAGELVVADRRPTRVDPAEVAAKAAEAAGALWRAMDAVEPHPFAPAAA